MDKELLIRHLDMNYNLAKINFDDLNNPETLKVTNKHNLLLVVLCYCQAFGGIWKIYNNFMTYDTSDMIEIEMIKKYHWCEKFAGEYFGFAI